MKYKFIVTCSSSSFTQERLRKYIEKACNGWSGAYHMTDPLFNKEDFTVKNFPSTQSRLKNKKQKTKQNTKQHGKNNKRTN